MVCVSVEDGLPEVIDRRRVELIEPGLPKHLCEHEAVGVNAAEAERLLQEVRDSAAHCAEGALSRLRSGLGTTGEILAISLRTAHCPGFRVQWRKYTPRGLSRCGQTRCRITTHYARALRR